MPKKYLPPHIRSQSKNNLFSLKIDRSKLSGNIKPKPPSSQHLGEAPFAAVFTNISLQTAPALSSCMGTVREQQPLSWIEVWTPV